MQQVGRECSILHRGYMAFLSFSQRPLTPLSPSGCAPEILHPQSQEVPATDEWGRHARNDEKPECGCVKASIAAAARVRCRMHTCSCPYVRGSSRRNVRTG
jgi:hypothetical protein